MEKIIQFAKICKNYIVGFEEQKILKEINFSVFSGEIVAITGPSGSGKSTLMNIMGCLDKPSSGSCKINGINTSDMNSNDLAVLRNKSIGFVFQNFNLMGKRTILDNISLPLVYSNISKAKRYKAAYKLLEKVKLKGYGNYFPSQLSGGMKQRVAIARALVNNPKILLADEPTGNLDTKTTIEIIEIFKKLNKEMNITIIMITHEEEIAKMCDRIIRIRDGEIIFDQYTQGEK